MPDDAASENSEPIKRKAGRPKKSETVWRDLISHAPDKYVSERDVVRWVAQWITTPPDLIPLDSAPSKTAISVLKSAIGNEQSFFRDLWSKIIPTKSEIDRLEESSADSSDIERVIGKLGEFQNDA